jgi:pyridinium-3,5-bisthiocarboxylic acid mononucleotide nickel chelatase
LTTLYFDCFSGAAGDMILGALVDVGVPLDDLRSALGRLAVDRDAVWTERVSRAGITATRFCVRDESPVEHGHSHEHGHVHGHDHGHRHASAVVHDRRVHAHRTLSEIDTLIDGSSLSAIGKDRAKHLFARLGEAESAIHGTPLDRVHLHEVGALDSIIDIVGTVHALEMLKVDRVVASPLNVGSGSVRSAHGTYPVPAPATAWLLRDAPIYSGSQQAELVTPTGALLVTSYATGYGPIPPMRLKQVGYGAGTRDFPDSPNVLRILVGESDSTAPSHIVVVVEAEIDDMNPQIFGILMEQLLAEGALDVFYTSIQMKKNRPGTLLTVIAAPDARQRLTSTIFRETTTIGVRYTEMARECLERETITVDTPLGTVRFKVARRNGEVLNASPEFDDCARLARERNVPVKDVQAAATKAFLDRRP